MNKDRHEQYEEQVQFFDSSEALQKHLHQQVRQALANVLEQELCALCGGRYERGKQEAHYRAGSAPSYVMTECGREPMQRPRVRKIKSDGSSEEVTLSSWKLSQSPEQWESAVMHAILCGVSTRSASRNWESPGIRSNRLGFRLALSSVP